MLRRMPENAILADAFAAGVYGSIVVTALVAATRESHASSLASALSVLGTVVVFWLAHVWSQVTGQQIYAGASFSGRQAVEIARAEWPLIEAGVGPTIVLLLGWAGVFSDRAASNLALAVCGLQLATWGYLVGRRAYGGQRSPLLSALGTVLLGVVLVALEVSVLH